MINFLINLNIIFLILLFIIIILVSFFTNNYLSLISEDLFYDLSNFFNLFKNKIKILFIPLILIFSNFILFYYLIVTIIFFIIYLFEFLFFYFFKKSIFIYRKKNYNLDFFSEEIGSMLMLTNEVFIELPKMISYNIIYNFCKFFIKREKNILNLNFFKKIIFIRLFKLLFFIPYKCIILTTNIINIFYKNWFIEKLQNHSFYNFISYSLLDIYVCYVNLLKYQIEKKKIFFENDKFKINGHTSSKIILEAPIIEVCKTSSSFLNLGSFRSILIKKINKDIFHAGMIFKKNDEEVNLYSNFTTKKTLNAIDKLDDKNIKIDNGYINTGTYNNNVKNEYFTPIIIGDPNLETKPLDKNSVSNFISNPQRSIQMQANIIQSMLKPTLLEQNENDKIILKKIDKPLYIFTDDLKIKKSDELKRLQESIYKLDKLSKNLGINNESIDEPVCISIASRDFEYLKDMYNNTN